MKISKETIETSTAHARGFNVDSSGLCTYNILHIDLITVMAIRWNIRQSAQTICTRISRKGVFGGCCSRPDGKNETE